MTTGFADWLYLNHDDSTRNLWLDRTVAARAGLVRLEVRWVFVAKTRPTSPENPADPAYDFSTVDRAVRDASARGLDVMFTVFDAPNWADGPHRPANPYPGTSWRPKPSEYGAFARALAKRYSGSFPDPSSLGALPRVRFYEAWNEANLAGNLTPQWRKRKPVGAFIYRRLLNSFYDAVHSVRASNVVVAGGTAAYGDGPGGARVRPLRFLRAVLCLKGRRKLARGGCAPAERARFDVLSHHPINTSGPPEQSAIHPDDVSSADMGRVRRLLRAAERHRTVLPRVRRPLWATEMWFETDPAYASKGYRPKVQARFIEREFYLLWKAGVSVAINLQIRDAPYVDGLISQTGIFRLNGDAKPAYWAFRFPFVVDRLRRGRVRVWGKAPGPGTVSIQRRIGGRWAEFRRVEAAGNHIFSRRLRLRRGLLRATYDDEASLGSRVP